MTERPQPIARHLTANGLPLRYLEWGEPGALTIISVHGYTSSAEAFNALARRLSGRAHILAPDVRGHGDSGWSPDGASSTPTRPPISPPLPRRWRLARLC